MSSVNFFEITGDGDTIPKEEFDRDSNKVYIVVDHESRRIFLWKGSTAGIRLNFIGSRAMTEKRKEVGFHYTTEIVDDGDESETFGQTIARAGGEVIEPKKKALYVDSEAPPDLEAMARAQGIDVDNLEYDDDLSGTPVAGMGIAGQRPQKTLLSMMDEEGLHPSIPDTKGVPPTGMSKRDDTVERLKKAKELLEEFKETKGYTREMVVINNKLYKVASNNYEISEFDNALEGIFNVNEYVPRLICQSGEVILMELLKPTGEELDEELTQNLSDLTTMFMIEIDD